MTVTQQSQPADTERTEQGDSGAGATAREKAQEQKQEHETGKLGPANLERNGDGSIVIDGEKVDNPDDYKGGPLEGGPTDPNAQS